MNNLELLKAAAPNAVISVGPRDGDKHDRFNVGKGVVVVSPGSGGWCYYNLRDSKGYGRGIVTPNQIGFKTAAELVAASPLVFNPGPSALDKLRTELKNLKAAHGALAIQNTMLRKGLVTREKVPTDRVGALVWDVNTGRQCIVVPSDLDSTGRVRVYTGILDTNGNQLSQKVWMATLTSKKPKDWTWVPAVMVTLILTVSIILAVV